MFPNTTIPSYADHFLVHQTIAAYKVYQKTPELRLSPRTSDILTLGELDFKNAFHNLVESRLLDYLHALEHDPATVIAEFDKVRSSNSHLAKSNLEFS